MFRSLKGLYHLLVAVVANFWFGFPSRKLTVVGVTGTDGKTTTTTLIYEICTASGLKTSMITSVHAVIGGKEYDTGFHVTTPSAWWVQKYLREAVDHGDSHIVLEVTSHAIDQYRVFGVFFTIGILTNVTHEHLDWHGTFEKYLQTKLKLLKAAKIAIINHDDAESYTHAIPLLVNKKLITYGIRRDAMVSPKNYPFKTKLSGTFNQYNILAAIAATDALGIAKQVINHTIRDFGGISGRMEFILRKPFSVVVDFAHTPNALENVLNTVRSMTKKRLIHVFGTAGLRDHTKRPLMGAVSAKYADIIILTEEDYRTEDVNIIMDEIGVGVSGDKEVHRITNRKDAIAFALGIARAGDLVIFTGKGHEKSLCRGTKEFPWSDQEEVRKALRTLREEKNA